MRCRFDCGALLGVVLFATSNAVVLQVAAAAGLTKSNWWWGAIVQPVGLCYSSLQELPTVSASVNLP